MVEQAQNQNGLTTAYLDYGVRYKTMKSSTLTTPTTPTTPATKNSKLNLNHCLGDGCRGCGINALAEMFARSDDGQTTYKLFVEEHGNIACPCDEYQFTGWCAHVHNMAILVETCGRGDRAFRRLWVASLADPDRRTLRGAWASDRSFQHALAAVADAAMDRDPDPDPDFYPDYPEYSDFAATHAA